MTPVPDDTYTHGHADSVLRSHRRRTAADSCAYLLAHLRPGQRLLDLGCGPGTITVDLAARVAPGEVTGLDRSAEPLAEARALATASGVDNVRFEVGDGYRLPYPDHSYDVVHAHQVLQHLSDPVAALREMRRVCVPDGWIAVRDADYAAMTWYPQDARLDRWLQLYRQVARTNDAEPDAGRRLLSWARAAGLTRIAASASAWCYATPEDRAWWGGLWAERVVDSAMARQAVASGLSDAAELAEIATGWRHWAQQDDGWFAVLHGEILARP